MGQTIELHIERLVLHDLPAGDHRALGAAVERELARLLAEGGLTGPLAQGGAWATLSGGGFELAPGAGAEAIGAQVAWAVYGGIVDSR